MTRGGCSSSVKCGRCPRRKAAGWICRSDARCVCGCRVHTAQERLPQLHFELSDLMTQRRLGHLEHGSGARKSIHFHSANEVLELLEIYNGRRHKWYYKS